MRLTSFFIQVSSACKDAGKTRHRVPCPLDPSHTVFEDMLERHLRKCNTAKKPKPPCYSAHINAGLVDYQPLEEEKLPLSAFSTERIQDLIKRIEAAYHGTSYILYYIVCVSVCVCGGGGGGEGGSVKLHNDQSTFLTILQSTPVIIKDDMEFFILLLPEHITEIKTEVLSHPAMNSELSDPNNGLTALKHLKQQSSILAHLDALGILLSKDVCYIEFGAGKGKLSQCIQKSFEFCSDIDASKTKTTDTTSSSDSSAEAVPLSREITNVHFVLVDRDSCRHKVDGSHRVSSLVGIHYHRLLMDIEHLDLTRLGRLNEEGGMSIKQVVAVSKHLCGSATDLSLRCLVQSLPKNPKEQTRMSNSSKDESSTGLISSKLCGVLVALCCHHRCSWSQLAGRAFLEKFGFTAVDFHLICHMSSWAVCGVRPPAKTSPLVENCLDGEGLNSKDLSVSPLDDTTLGRLDDSKEQDGDIEKNVQATSKDTAGHKRWGYVPHPNEAIGLKCKRLIDLARLSYLTENGLNAWLVHYVDRSTSLENVLLIAVPPSS